ncbi:hypothetical protein DICPUDRAFT_160044 [Dictyostelium purpureum]|uniref:RasGTPase-activating protein n=1 Tax=Dictyostelium purpureum TaxID=5786 RepID=F1A5K7_DICPU|nr:uncharacterized protein DICPUDRAFT_160044 [Dictyostelium purpureum]EGC28522.1 hypothetical protein DICPUDRAFT_160044 [Dictyostelium purpureum]|eukprot:XP_003294951.1 hypothetical protein DICPUDRAFT_160044 [Dictyostelium purpureum]
MIAETIDINLTTPPITSSTVVNEELNKNIEEINIRDDDTSSTISEPSTPIKENNKGVKSPTIPILTLNNNIVINDPQQFNILESSRKSNVLTSSSTYESLLKQQKTKDCNLTVKVFEARNLIEARLRKRDVKSGKSFKRAQNLLTEISSPNLMTFSDTTDPYCIVSLDKQKHRTRTIPKKLNPFWCEEFQMEISDPSSAKVVLSIMDDKKYSSDEHIGKLVIPINTLKDQKERELWFPLTTPSSSKKVPQIQIQFTFKPISLTDPSQPGHIHWKILFGRNLSHSLASPSAATPNGAPSSGGVAASTSQLGGSTSADNISNTYSSSTPYINWSVRSKRGDIIIDEEGISWADALTNGVTRELRESIDCITFVVWKYEPKTYHSTSMMEDDPSGLKSPRAPGSGSTTPSTPPKDSGVKSPDSKTRSSSNASTTPPLLTPKGPNTTPTSSHTDLPSPSILNSSNTSTSSLISNNSAVAIDPKDGYEQYFIGQGTVLASHIDIETLCDQWLCLYPKPNAENKFGDIRLKLKYSEEVVLPLQSYSPLLNLLQEEHLYTIHLLGKVTKHREAVSNNLIRVFEKTGNCLYLLKSLTDHEIDSTNNPDIIFRGNSLATKSVDLYMKLIGIPYLAQTIGPLIKKIYSSKKSCEIDPTKLEKGEDIKKNCKNLLSWVKKMTNAILSSVNNCPGPLREVFRSIQEKVVQRYPRDEITRYTAVSGFIFLRFFCPAILAPKLFELMPDHPGIKTTRSLILIAKTLQNLANQVEFGEYKEDFMRDMNKFVIDNMDNMKQFINTLSIVPNDCPPGSVQNPIILEKELACLYRHLIKQRQDMIDEMESTESEPKTEQEKESFSRLMNILKDLEEDVLFASKN